MKNRILTTFQKISSLIRNFGFTMFFLILWTTVWVIEKKLFPAYIAFITPDMFKCMKKLDILFCFMMLAFFSSLLIETCLKRKWQLKLISFPLAGVVSGTLTFLMHYDNISFSLFKRIDGIITGYVIVLTALIIYYSFRKSDLSFSKYIERIFYSFLPIILTYIVLLIGGIFVLIIAKILWGRWLMSSEMLMIALFMLYIVPSCIYILNHIEMEGHSR